jgi:hypothetical protein
MSACKRGRTRTRPESGDHLPQGPRRLVAGRALGDGPRAPIRIDAAELEAWVEARPPGAEVIEVSIGKNVRKVIDEEIASHKRDIQRGIETGGWLWARQGVGW